MSEKPRAAGAETRTPPGSAGEIPADAPARRRMPPPVSLYASKSSALPVRVRGRRRSPRDAYHWLLTTPWSLFAALGFGAYLVANAAFALLYLVDRTGVAGARAGDFLDAFFFSVQTFGTIGYGALYPKDVYANAVMTFENFIGISFIAVTTGVIFARVSRPTARVIFSRNALVTLHDGRPTFMFRAANERVNRLLEAEVTLSMTRDVVTAEGRSMRRFEDMKVVRARSPLFALTWTIMHVVDENSPLFGITAEEFRREGGQILVLVSGMDEIFAQRIHARHSYAPADLLWNRHFADVLLEDEQGRWVLDYRKFHDLEEMQEELGREADLAAKEL